MSAGKVSDEKFPEDILISFVAIGINIIAGIIGVASPKNPAGREAAYYVLLVICFLVFAIYLATKYFFLFFTSNIKPCCANKCSRTDSYRLPGKEGMLKFLHYLGSCWWNWSLVYESVFCLMALLYLAGDNLEQMVCKEDTGICPVTGRVIMGTSLMLNILLTLLKGTSMKPKTPSAFLVVGILGNVYYKLMQIAASVLTIDQTVTTILNSIEYNETIRSNNDSMINEETIQTGAIGILTAISGIVLLVLLVALVIIAFANRRLCCCCCRNKQVKWYEMFGQWACGICVVLFVISFMIGDINWIWEFFETDIVSKPANIVRLFTLTLALVLLFILSMVYIGGICLPGVGVVVGEEEFFLPKNASDKGLQIDGNVLQKPYNEWGKDPKKDPTVRMESQKCDLKGEIKVEDHYGKTDITFSIDREMSCMEAYKHWVKFDSSLYKLLCRRNDSHDDTPWMVQAYVGKDTTVGTTSGQVGNGTSDHDPEAKEHNGEESPSARKGVEMQPMDIEKTIRDNSGTSL